MSDKHETGRHLIQAGERFVGRTLAIVLGIVMIVSGMGMGVTMVLLPIGVVVGLVGLLLLLWGIFYSTPSAAAAGEAPGHGPAPGHH